MLVKEKKIIWLAHEANMSGANISLIEYVNVLKEDYDFHIILPHEGNMQNALQQIAIPSTVIYQYGWATNFPWWKLMKRVKIMIRTKMAIAQTKQLIKKEKADVVFTNTLIPFVAAKAAYRLQIPHVWWIHEFGEEDFGFSIGWGNPKKAFGEMQKWSRLIICNSDAVTKKFMALMPTASIKRLYQPVSWNKNIAVAKEKKTKFLMFGQIAPSKGHKEVLIALAEIKAKKHLTVSLHIKGPCEMKNYLDELHQLIDEHELDVKIESGFFNKEEVLPLYETLIVASESEAFGRVIIEANKAGLKVIVKNSGGAPELVNETNGLFYNTRQELVEILSGEKKIPVAEIRMNYNEEDEIQKLKKLLAELT